METRISSAAERRSSPSPSSTNGVRKPCSSSTTTASLRGFSAKITFSGVITMVGDNDASRPNDGVRSESPLMDSAQSCLETDGARQQRPTSLPGAVLAADARSITTTLMLPSPPFSTLRTASQHFRCQPTPSRSSGMSPRTLPSPRIGSKAPGKRSPAARRHTMVGNGSRPLPDHDGPTHLPTDPMTPSPPPP